MSEYFSTETTFADLGLAPKLLEGIAKLGFEHPTKVQAQLIPPALAGKDVIAQSKTGTGKTAAFGLPLIQQIDRSKPLEAMILVPTRELAVQVAEELRDLARFTPIRVIPIYGGQRIKIQAEGLKKNPNLVV